VDEVAREATRSEERRGRGRSRFGNLDPAELVDLAANGGPAAWEELVRRFGPLVTSVVRGCGVRAADVADVAQTTWMRLFQHLPRLREPERVASWLVVTARHESWRTLERSHRAVAVPEVDDRRAEATPDPSDHVIAAEQLFAEVLFSFAGCGGSGLRCCLFQFPERNSFERDFPFFARGFLSRNPAKRP